MTRLTISHDFYYFFNYQPAYTIITLITHYIVRRNDEYYEL